jgi:hypothetical protein
MAFLSTARCTPYLPYKVALYMPILESFIHNECLRGYTKKYLKELLFYIGKGDERMEIFETIKVAYDLRSRFFSWK